MIRESSLAAHTLYADLFDRCIDESTRSILETNGSVIIRQFKNKEGLSREFYYYNSYKKGPDAKKSSKYIGEVGDPNVEKIIKDFERLKIQDKERKEIVRSLVAFGFGRPNPISGLLLEQMEKEGVFRLGAVLVGTCAFQTYGPLLGFHSATNHAITSDLDIASFRSISIHVQDETIPLIDILKSVDQSFRAVPHENDRALSSFYVNDRGFKVDVLSAHRGSDDYMGRPVKMPSLGGTEAEPLRYLDFAIYKPVQAIALYGKGISVKVPDPARYAVHKMIISTQRRGDGSADAKKRKDILQSKSILTILHKRGESESIMNSFKEAWERGPKWKSSLVKSSFFFKDEEKKLIPSFILKEASRNGNDDFGL